jgi:hypothetical protein
MATKANSGPKNIDRIDPQNSCPIIDMNSENPKGHPNKFYCIYTQCTSMFQIEAFKAPKVSGESGHLELNRSGAVVDCTRVLATARMPNAEV